MPEPSIAAIWRPTPDQVTDEFELLVADVRHFTQGVDAELGAVRYRHTDWPPPPWVWPVVIVLPAFAFIGHQPLWSNLVLAAIIFLGALGLLVLAGSKTLTVHDRALVLGSRFRRRHDWVVPLCTIDHSRTRVNHNYPSMGRRIGSIRAGYRTAFYTRTAVSIEGLTARVASRRPPGFRMERTLPRPWERYLEVPRAHDAPLEDWAAWPVWSPSGTLARSPMTRSMARNRTRSRGSDPQRSRSPRPGA